MKEVIAAGSRLPTDGICSTLHWSRRAVNLEFGGRVMTLMDRDGILMPSSVILDTDSFDCIGSALFDGREFISENLSFTVSATTDLRVHCSSEPDVSRIYDSLLPYLSRRERSISSALLSVFGCGVARPADALERAVFEDQRAVLSSRRSVADVACGLLGKGFGLTPSGDDFTEGVIAVFNMLRLDTGRIRAAAGAYGNAFSRTILLDALDGFYPLPLQGLIQSLLDGRDAAQNAEKLLQTGHTSGMDTLSGMVYALLRLKASGGRALRPIHHHFPL